ncbi:MAG: phospholipase D family protein [Aquimonas sp.]|nr:phospholipase D family protein [Aquimonas sp.]
MPPESRSALRLLALLLASLALAGCMPSKQTVLRASGEAASRQDRSLDCTSPLDCAEPSPLRAAAARAVLDSTPEVPRHVVLSLESGRDALLARLHLIRAARRSIEVQSFIFAEDDAGHLLLDELLAAARRGVRVRLLLDQLFSLDDVSLLAGLAQAHVNFELRLYNPTFAKGSTSRLEFVGGILCCFTRFNQRMHNKLLLIDDLVGLTGGRNIQERYFDLDAGFNYRDRDIIVGGPAAAEMGESFEQFWSSPRSLTAAALRDVRPALARAPSGREVLADPPWSRPERIRTLRREASDPQLLQALLIEPMHRVGRVDFYSDGPDKQLGRIEPGRRDSSERLRASVVGAREEIVLQTPYLVLSRPARDTFRALRQRPSPPRVRISTNSLASTDAFPVYALSHKYKRTYLREFGFEIHEYRPHPADAPIALEEDEGSAITLPLRFLRSESSRAFGSATGSLGEGESLTPRRRARAGPLPLRSLGMRVGLHSKSMVVDGRLAIIGSHNFDPRSDNLNTESVVLVHDRGFADELRETLLVDMAPENAWIVAPRARLPWVAGLNYSLGKLSEWLPLFDVWPWRYATSYELLPHCEPMPPNAPGFLGCHRAVGDFPEVEIPFKAINTRILTAFGAGLAPIL